MPSKAEWSAFGDMCFKLMKMTSDRSSWKEKFGFDQYYWSSSQAGAGEAYSMQFDGAKIGVDMDDMGYYFCLSTKF